MVRGSVTSDQALTDVIPTQTLVFQFISLSHHSRLYHIFYLFVCMIHLCVSMYLFVWAGTCYGMCVVRGPQCWSLPFTLSQSLILHCVHEASPQASGILLSLLPVSSQEHWGGINIPQHMILQGFWGTEPRSSPLGDKLFNQ